MGKKKFLHTHIHIKSHHFLPVTFFLFFYSNIFNLLQIINIQHKTIPEIKIRKKKAQPAFLTPLSTFTNLFLKLSFQINNTKKNKTIMAPPIFYIGAVFWALVVLWSIRESVRIRNMKNEANRVIAKDHKE